MTEVTCPCCGRPAGDTGQVSVAQALPTPLGEDLAFSQAQLIEYARDLARVYAVQKRMEPYLPNGLRERISEGGKLVSGERRQVTVLFADLVDFTRLTVKLDPEDVFNLMNACFRQLVSHILKHGGVVDKFLGDGIMALFGVPGLHEDDPARAVKAALDMDMEMRDFSRRMHAQLGSQLQLHIGISCGEVIAGSVGVDERLSYTVMGKTVNLAFRLQELASPGDILVSQSVQQATQNLFRYRYQDAIQVKGFDELVPVFKVENRQEPQAAPRTAADINLPWTGREREMGDLDDLLSRLTQGEGGVVLIEGDAGVGKTRLVRQWLVARTPPGVTVWTGAAHMVQFRIGYSLWRNMMQWASPVSTNPAESAAAGDVASFPGRVTPLPAAILALVYSQPAQPAKPEEAEDTRVQIFQTMRHMLITQSEVAPLVLVIDNWQWVDEISRHLLLSLLSLADRHRILFCILSRPAPGQSGDMARAIEFQALRNRYRIDLSPLGAEDIRYMLSSLFETGGLSDDVHSVFLSWTQGNPLFLKELILFLAAQGIIEPRGQGWRLAQAYPLSSLRFPPTLRGLTVANLDRLPDELQEALHFAAVIGSTFSVQLLRAVMSHNRQTDKLDNSVAELVRRGLVERSALDPDTFVFRHAIVQESIYDRLLSQERQTLHRTIAEEMENLAEDNASASVELIAYHFIEAGLPAAAVSYLIQAGQRAGGHAASRLAIEHYTLALVALEFAPRHQTERLEVEIGLADAYLQSHQYDEAISHYQSALEMCEDLEKRIELVQTLSHAYAAQNNLDKAWELLEAALESISVSDVPATSLTRGRVFADCAQIEWRLGNRRRAELWAREATAILEGSSEHTSLAASYQTLGRVYAMLGQHSLANSYNARATAHLRATGRLQGAVLETP